MPKFTIESTFTVPHYRHRTYEAPTVEEACKMALADEDWEQQEKDYDSSSATYLTGAWEGEDAAYEGPAVLIPADMGRLQLPKGVSALDPLASDMLDTLVAALPYVESAEQDQAYKPGAVAKIVKQMRDVIGKAEAR